MAIVTAHDPKAPQVVGAPDVRQKYVTETLLKPPTEEASTPPEAAKPDPKLVALANKERAMREQQRQASEKLAAERAAIAAEKAEIEQVKAWKNKFSTDPWAALIEAGYSPEQATELILNQPKSQDVQLTKVQQEIQALKAAHEQATQQMKDAQQQQYEQAKKQISNEVRLLVDSDQEFETIKAMDAQDAVTELIEMTFNESGVLMPIEQAAKEVEEHLLEEAMKIASISKIKSRFGTQPTAEQKMTPTQKQQTIQTLTNRTATTQSAPKSARERAIAAFMGKQQS